MNSSLWTEAVTRKPTGWCGFMDGGRRLELESIRVQGYSLAGQEQDWVHRGCRSEIVLAPKRQAKLSSHDSPISRERVVIGRSRRLPRCCDSFPRAARRQTTTRQASVPLSSPSPSTFRLTSFLRPSSQILFLEIHLLNYNRFSI